MTGEGEQSADGGTPVQRGKGFERVAVTILCGIQSST